MDIGESEDTEETGYFECDFQSTFSTHGSTWISFLQVSWLHSSKLKQVQL